MPTRKVVIPMLVLLLLAPTLNTPGIGQVDNFMTAGFTNGRFWKAMGHTEKISYLVGFYDAIKAARAEAAVGLVITKGIIGESYDSALILAEQETELDTFYKQGVNGPIAICVALQYVSKKAKGATSKELEEFLAKARKLSAGSSR